MHHNPPSENKEDTALERHSRKCKICSHPDREAIEEQFIHWIRPVSIARIYGLEWKSLYRHVHALDLVTRRSRNMKSVLENILERGPEAEITADAVLRTVRAYCTCLTDDNRWIDPPTPVVFTTQHQLSPATAPQSIPGVPGAEATIEIPAAPPQSEQLMDYEPQVAVLVGSRSKSEEEGGHF